MKDYDQALKNFKKAIDLQPNSALGYKGMGDAYVNSGIFDEAITAYQKALKSTRPTPRP
jgi:tetratricopeptide (TPR) repeat protein